MNRKKRIRIVIGKKPVRREQVSPMEMLANIGLNVMERPGGKIATAQMYSGE